MKRENFIAQIAPYAVLDMARTIMIGKPVLASYTIAQACLESDDGVSAINGNYFGVKGSGKAYQTKEFINGEWVVVTASFEAYGSMEQSVIGHSQFLIENSRYTRYGVFSAGEKRDWELACHTLQNAGYATDPEYANLLIGIIKSHDLQQFDKEADDMLAVITQMQNQISDLTKTVSSLTHKPAPDWFTKEFGGVEVLKGIVNDATGSEDFWRITAEILRLFKAKGL